MSPVPPKDPSWPQFDLRVEDLAHPGVSIFFEAVQPLAALRNAIIASYKWLYTPDTAPTKLVSALLEAYDTYGDITKVSNPSCSSFDQCEASLTQQEIITTKRYTSLSTISSLLQNGRVTRF